MALPPTGCDEPKRFLIQLYHRTATQVDPSGKDVLEVGCATGAEPSYLRRILYPAFYSGLDLNPAGIAFCRARHNLPGLDFVRGDAENLPFPDQSFDAVINIESSHCYPRFPASSPKWRARRRRALPVPDLRPRVSIAQWEATLAEAPMRMVSRTDIDTEVLRAMDKNSQRTRIRSIVGNRHTYTGSP